MNSNHAPALRATSHFGEHDPLGTDTATADTQAAPAKSETDTFSDPCTDAILYCRTGAGGAYAIEHIDRQMASLRAWAEQRGWSVVAQHHDVGSTRRLADRPGLAHAIDDARAAGGTLIASHLDRITRSARDLQALLDQSEREGWSLLPLNMPTQAGRLWKPAAELAQPATAHDRRPRKKPQPARRSKQP